MDGVERSLEPAVRHLKAPGGPRTTDGHRDIQSFYALNFALSCDTPCGQSAVYHRKLGPRTIRLNLVTNRLLIS